MELGTVFSNTLKIKLVVHTAFAFERVVKKSPLAYSDEIDLQLNEILKAVSKTIKPLEKQLLLKLSKDEKLFISEVLINEWSVLLINESVLNLNKKNKECSYLIGHSLFYIC